MVDLNEFVNRCGECQAQRQSSGKPLLRCSSCHTVRYCSVACQRKNWNAHRPTCRRQRTAAAPRHVTDAWKELSHLVATASPEEVKHDFCVASDKVREESIETGTPKSKAVSRPHVSSPPIQPIPSTPAPQSTLSHHSTTNTSSLWTFYVEDLSQVSTYQILLRPTLRHAVVLRRESLSISTTQSTLKSIIEVCYNDPLTFESTSKQLRIELPKPLSPQTTQVHLVADGQAFLVRVTYQSDDPCYDQAEPWIPPSLLSPEESHWLACASCHAYLLRTPLETSTSDAASTTIQRVLPLPSGRWDEMQDYLVCYEGQASFDFGSASTFGQRGTLLEDATIIVAHRLDVGMAASVTALSGYGSTDDESIPTTPSMIDMEPSATTRGSRQWRDAVGGATLTCSYCASLVGFAPIALPDTYRLLKHCLVVRKDVPDPTIQPIVAISSFIAHEMVRYAETKAIFNFVIGSDDSRNAGSFGRVHFGSTLRRPILRLRLVSWATMSLSNSETLDSACTQSRNIEWKKRCKILYQHDTEDVSSSHPWSQWTWANAHDWCCPTDPVPTPATKDEAKPDAALSPLSFVRITLTAVEWNQLDLELKREAHWYAKDVAQATIAATLGRSMGQINGLASIAL